MGNFLTNFIKQKVLICIIFTFCLIAGIVSFINIPIDAFPDLTNNQVQILTESPGMAPLEVEQLVTIPIEATINGLPKIEIVRSISKLGLSVVTVVFKDNVDIYFARQLVNERLQTARARLPQGLNPQLGPVTTGMGEIYQYVIEGNGYSATDLKTLHDWEIKYQLRTVPGVNEVNTWGGQTLEYQITLSPEKMLQYHLTFNEVFDALKNNNENFSGGIVEHVSEQYIVRGLGLVKNLDDLRNIMIKYQDGSPIYIRNIANVEYSNALRQGATTKDGKGEVVTGIIMMLKGENSRIVIRRVKNKIEEIGKILPESVKIKPYYDQTLLIEQTLETVEKNLFEGSLLVIAVLLLMLGNIRAALIVTLTIPLSLMFSFMGMKALGISANIMSLGALDFGMIVDGSIYMVENIMLRLHSSKDSNLTTFEIVQRAMREMTKPIFFGVLIITTVYMPILSLEGMEYKMFSPMVFAVCFALLGSLLIALILVPVLCSIFLNKNIVEKKSIIVEKVREPYLRLLDRALKYKYQTVFITVIVFLISVASLAFMGSEFVPKLDEGDISIQVTNMPSISLSEATKTTTLVEKTLLEVPEVKNVISKIGRADLATDPMGVYQADIFVKLRPKSKWRFGLSKTKLVEEMNKKLSQEIPGSNLSFTQPIEMRVNELVSGVKSDVAVKIFGSDMDVLMQKAREVEKVLKTIKGVKDLQVEKISGAKQVTVIPDRVKMSRYGVSVADLRDVISTAIMGKQVSEILDGKKRFALRVKFPQGIKTDPSVIGNLLVETSYGGKVPIAQVSTVQIGEGLEVVNREFGERRIIVQCNVRGRDIGSFVKEAEKKVEHHVKLPTGYYIKWGGQFEHQERAMKRLSIVVPFSILMIFFLLMMTFSSIKHSLLVMFNVPFAMVGGILALWLRGMYLSVPAIVGFVALFGVSILNGLVLITQFNKLLADGHSMKETIIRGVKIRLRPVLMTALVATLGFMPMALSTSSGAEVQKPLATVVIGGLISSTFLTLIVLPILYSEFCNPKVEIIKKYRRYCKICLKSYFK